MSGIVATPSLLLTHRLAFGLRVFDALTAVGADGHLGAALTGVGVDADVVAEWSLPIRQRPAGPPVGIPKLVGDREVPMPATWRRLAAGKELGRFHVNHTPNLPNPVTVRITDRRRRFVSRRLEVPFPTLAAVLDAEQRDVAGPGRAWRVGVWPGAGYQGRGALCGLRGRAVDPTGAAVPWVRVVARVGMAKTIVGRAHGDDRGEFLVVLGLGAEQMTTPKTRDFPVELTVWVPPKVPADELPFPGDPLATLPVQRLSVQPAGIDDVSVGAVVPDRFDAAPPRTVRASVGRLVPIAEPLQVPAPV